MGVRHIVMQLEMTARRATAPFGTLERTLPSITQMHLSTHRARHMARRRLSFAHRSIRRCRTRLLSLAKSPLHLLVDQQICRTLDDHGQIAVRHLVPHEILELLQLVMQRLRRGTPRVLAQRRTYGACFAA